MSRLNRASKIIQASFLADAATMPLHWIYNQKDIAVKLGDNAPAFFSPPSCPFYNYPAGVLSPYGDESIPLLRSISSAGEFDFDNAAETSYKFFKTYPDASEKGYEGRLNHAPKSFVESRDRGHSWKECANQSDFQANGIAKVPVIVARYAGSSQLLEKTEEMVGILQSTQLSVLNSVLYAKVLSEVLLTNEHPSKVLTSLLASSTLSEYERNVLSFVTSDEKIAEWIQFCDDLAVVDLLKIKGAILTHHLKSGGSVRETLSSITGLGAEESAILDRLTHTESARGIRHDLNKIMSSIGLNCNLPGVLVASLYIARVSSTFEEAVTSNLIAGGDNCSRAMVIGALFGAWSDDTSTVDRIEGQSLPSGWVEKVNVDLWSEIREAADKIANDNKSL
eukprot:gene36503-45016_t